MAAVDEVVEEVDTTPQVQGTAKSCWNVVFDIIYYPDGGTHPYGIRAQDPANSVFNKVKSFRTYDEAQEYIEGDEDWTLHGSKCPTPESPVEYPEEEGWEFIGKAEASDGKMWFTYKPTKWADRLKRKIVDPYGEVADKHFNSWMEMNAYLWPPESTETTTNTTTNTTTGGAREEVRGQYLGLRVY